MDKIAAFDKFFEKATGNPPYDYQTRLATEDNLPGLVNVPTGLGKTAAIVLAWLWRRSQKSGFRERTPRRLVYCLPMRTLVEQTARAMRKWLKNLGLDREVKVYILMGGEQVADWDLYPEQDAILIGTQDMLLSRALNRGYAMSRYRWPIQFGLLHNDCLWVFDEVQLMGSGLATTAQLEAFARRLWHPAKPTHFLWVSATLDDSFLQTRDRRDWNLTDAPRLGLSEEDLHQVKNRLCAPKKLHVVKDRPKVAKILEAHPRGRISLLVLNTVPVAKSVYEEVRQKLTKPDGKNKPKGPRPETCLLHSRFRPMDREQHMERLIEFLEQMDETGAVPNSEGLIVISTQVVEAGVDLSSVRLWSEIAPWPLTIQRLGRLNREGAQPDALATFWMPKADDSNKGDASPNAKRVGPYEKGALDAAKKLLGTVIAKQADGLAYRDAIETVLATKESQETMRIEPDVVLRPDDFFELFSTEPDLAGGFTNVSQFVRDQDRNADVHVFWRDFDPVKVRQPNESPPVRKELCSVPFFEFRQFVVKARVAWEWNSEVGKWEPRRAADIQPGMTLLLPKSAGGYRSDIGWTGNAKDRDFEVLPGLGDEDSLDRDFLSGAQGWVSLSNHLGDVETQMRELLRAVEPLEPAFGEALMTAARWHDWGKAVGKWQDAVKDYVAKACDKLKEVARSGIPGFEEVAAEWCERLRSVHGCAELWGKFPDIRAASLDLRLNLGNVDRAVLSKKLTVPFRPGLRHEAASALAAWQSWLAKSDGLTALAVYLIACHHGKVRAVLRSTAPKGDDVFGLTEGATLQSLPRFFPNPTSLRADAKYVGACGDWDEANANFTLTSPSWHQMVAELLGPKRQGAPAASEVIPDNEPRDLGPLTTAYLEALLRSADARASCQPGKGGIS